MTLVWRFPAPLRAIASAPHGGGLGVRRWVVNAQVPMSHGRRDPDNHLRNLAVSLGLPGRGVGMLTAADVRRHVQAPDGGVEVCATVGLGHPTLAAAPDEAGPISLVGTINLIAVLPERLADAGLGQRRGDGERSQGPGHVGPGPPGDGDRNRRGVHPLPRPGPGTRLRGAALAVGGPPGPGRPPRRGGGRQP